MLVSGAIVLENCRGKERGRRKSMKVRLAINEQKEEERDKEEKEGAERRRRKMPWTFCGGKMSVQWGRTFFMGTKGTKRHKQATGWLAGGRANKRVKYTKSNVDYCHPKTLQSSTIPAGTRPCLKGSATCSHTRSAGCLVRRLGNLSPASMLELCTEILGTKWTGFT